MSKKLNEQVQEIREEIDKPIPEHTPIEEKKMSDKKAKPKKAKTEKPKAKTEKPKTEKAKTKPKTKTEDMVTLAELCTEAGITPAVARHKLRSSEVENPEGRWAWVVGSRKLKAAQKVLGID